jgi:type IV fimbrial biogenesis protein FimT
MHVSLRSARIRPANGFTLVELMVAIFVATILLVIAIPSFTSIINSNRLTTTANALIGALNTAKMAAIQRNAPVQFCSNSATSNTSDVLGTNCGTNAGQIWALPSSSSSAATMIQAAPTELSIPSIQIHGTSAAIQFNGLGQGLTAGTTTPFGNGSTTGGVVVDVCSTALSTNNHVQINMVAGTLITTTTSSGACP